MDTGAPFTTRPLGRKKLVCATRSINCMTIAASSGGNASSNRNAVTNCAHTKKWKPHPGQPFGAQLNDRGDEIDGAEQRRCDQENKSDQPESLAVEQRIMYRPSIGESCKRGIGSPTTLGCAARHEETDEHDHTA